MAAVVILILSFCVFLSLIGGAGWWFFLREPQHYYIDNDDKRHPLELTTTEETYTDVKRLVLRPKKDELDTGKVISINDLTERVANEEEHDEEYDSPITVTLQIVDDGPPPVFTDGMKDVDFGGHDIACHTNLTLDEQATKCRDLCENDNNCVAYNHHHYDENDYRCCMKSIGGIESGGNLNTSANLTLFIKNSAIGDYTETQDKDSPGNNLIELAHFKDNIPALKAVCSAKDDCKGFNSNGWLKSTVVGTLSDSSGTKFYTKN